MKTIEQRKQDVVDELERQIACEKEIIAVWCKAPYPEMFHKEARDATARLSHWEATLRNVRSFG